MLPLNEGINVPTEVLLLLVEKEQNLQERDGRRESEINVVIACENKASDCITPSLCCMIIKF